MEIQNLFPVFIAGKQSAGIFYVVCLDDMIILYCLVPFFFVQSIDESHK